MTELPNLYSPYDEPMWESIAAHEMRLQKCDHCDTVRYPPGPACPECLSLQSTWEAISGRGRVLAWTMFHRQYLPAYPPPTLVVAVMLEEGAMMVANMEADAADRLSLDAPVQLYYEMHPDGFELPRFRLA